MRASKQRTTRAVVRSLRQKELLLLSWCCCCRSLNYCCAVVVIFGESFSRVTEIELNGHVYVSQPLLTHASRNG